MRSSSRTPPRDPVLQSFCGSDMRAAYYGGTALTGAGQTSACSSSTAQIWPTWPCTTRTRAKQSLTFHGRIRRRNFYHFQRRHRTNPGHGAGDGNGPGAHDGLKYVGSTDTAILSAMVAISPLHYRSKSAVRGAGPGGPQHPRPVLRADGGSGPELLSGLRRLGLSGRAISAMAGGRCLCCCGRRNGLDNPRRGRALEIGNRWVDSGGGSRTNSVPIPSWQQLPA